MNRSPLVAIWRTRANRARNKARDIARNDDPNEFEDLVPPDQHWHSVAEAIDQCADDLEQQK